MILTSNYPHFEEYIFLYFSIIFANALVELFRILVIQTMSCCHYTNQLVACLLLNICRVHEELWYAALQASSSYQAGKQTQHGWEKQRKVDEEGWVKMPIRECKANIPDLVSQQFN